MDGAMTIEQLEQAVAGLIDTYVASLTQRRVSQVDQVRLEARAEGVSVLYDRHAPHGMPHLVVSIGGPQ